LKDDERYSKYFKMLKMGLPVGAAVGRAVQDGCDAAEIEAVLNRDPEEIISGGSGGGGGAAAAAKPANPMLAGIMAGRGGGGGGRGDMLAGIGAGRGGGGGRGAMLAGIGAGRGGGGGRGAMLAGIGAGRGGGGPSKKASVTEEDIGIKPKPKKEPSKKMKGLFWSNVQPKNLAGTVWMTMQENSKIDFQDLENDFFDPSKQVATPAAGGEKAAAKAEKPKEISLIDPKRNQNVSIALARFKFDNEEFRRRIIAFDAEIINIETISKIQMMIPEEDEIGLMNDFDGDIAMLAKVEKFYVEMVKIPRLKQRLECAAFNLSFDENLQILQNKLDAFNKASEQIKTSKGFVSVLEMVMAIGNHLNGGSDRGQAHGFRLDVLAKFSTMKANDRKKGSLMNFLLKQVEKQRKTLLELPSEMANVGAASSTNLNQMLTDFKQLEAGVKKVRMEVDKFATMEKPVGAKDVDDPVTSFKKKFEPFALKAEEACARFSAGVEAMKKSIVDNMEAYGDKITGDFPAEKAQMFFGNLAGFLTSFANAKRENELAAEAEAKAAKRAKEASAKKAAKGAAADDGDESKDKPKDLFSAFKAASSANTDDVVKEFQMRLAKKRTGSALAHLP
jgi:hypothetical protein